MVLNMMESGLLEPMLDKEKVFKFHQMEACMKVGGKMINLMEKEDSSALMVTYIKEIWSIIRLKVLENMSILMEQHTKVIGKMICNTEMD